MFLNTLVLHLFVFLQFLSVCYNQAPTDNSTCTAPNGGNGRCVNIQQCAPLLSFLTNNYSNPIHQSTRNTLLRALRCGYEGLQLKVCCLTNVSSENNITQITLMDPDPAQPGYYSEMPPSYTGHSNIRLFPRDCGPLRIRPPSMLIGGGGTKVDLFEFPWMALLSYNTSTGQQFKCGGTIINEKYILTAAHCITFLKGDELIAVRVGEHDLRTETDCEYDNVNCAPPYQDIGIEEILPHPDYSGLKGRPSKSKLQHDIGLIRLATPIDLSKKNTKAVCLPMGKLNEKRLENKQMLVTGWGTTEHGTPSPVLLKMRIPYVPNDYCSRILNGSIGDGVGFRQLCAGGVVGVDACAGDSGGPIVIEDSVCIQYGIVSFGPRGCAVSNYPGVYTRVSHYIRWILDTIKP